MHLKVRERSTKSVTAEVYRRLEGSEEFLQLVEEGVLSLVRSKGTGRGIRAGPYVGHFEIAPDLIINIVEKVEGTVAGLIRWASPQDIRELLLPSLHGDADTMLEMFAERLVDSTASYLQGGRRKEYLQSLDRVSAPRGRVDINRTISLRARGNRAQLACHINHLSADLATNRLLALGLFLAQIILEQRSREDYLAIARSYSSLFRDVGWTSFQRLDPHQLQQQFTAALASVEHTTSLFSALSYSRAVTLHLGSWEPDGQQLAVPHSFVMNLERLFEDAVRECLRDLFGKENVVKGSHINRPLFVDRHEAYIVDPDAVIYDNSKCPLVVDCKYKDLTGNPSHSDVYQLLSHAEAIGTSVAALIFPSDEPSISQLGVTSRNLEVFVVTVRPTYLHADLQGVAKLLAIGGKELREVA